MFLDGNTGGQVFESRLLRPYKSKRVSVGAVKISKYHNSIKIIVSIMNVKYEKVAETPEISLVD